MSRTFFGMAYQHFACVGNNLNPNLSLWFVSTFHHEISFFTQDLNLWPYDHFIINNTALSSCTFCGGEISAISASELIPCKIQ